MTLRYCQPEMREDDVLDIRDGRHPVIETLEDAERFVPNDTYLNNDDQQLHILTGPNMAGKSTYLRQVGLIVIMAQAGCFVPAERAEIGLVDRVFTRVGASDRLVLGESTFLVEMNETSRILANATNDSLVLLDEVGRGTSTYDGLSIAWALCELLHQEKRLRPRTIFATHFHELTRLAQLFPRIRSYQVQVRRWQDEIIFLRKVIPGGCDDSFGIEVAKLAGIPEKLTSRAKEILQQLEAGSFAHSAAKGKPPTRSAQLGLFQSPPSEVVKRLKGIDLDRLTPLDALNLLAELREQADKEDDS
jgi:DNA mismatch repair protein MutS